MKLYEMTAESTVIGSGAAGFQTALRLYQNGDTDTVLAAENIKAGTSRNTGSDKQTYYKLSLAGGDSDSVRSMAEDLFSGGAVDGDTALCEAALSARSFYRLVELGVPFPSTEYGEFMGYKTDHDHGRRATSAGPYTSKQMTEALEREALREHVRILDHLQMISLLVQGGQVYGTLFLDTAGREWDRDCIERDGEGTYLIIWSRNVVLATGGPAYMYYDSVYPQSQLGADGAAFEAGVRGKNLTEWQFGLASKNPRWNVSGTYMQILPTFLSTQQDGSDEREFLLDYYDTPEEMLSNIFLKGYQWPFDVNKVFGGSSVIDLLVYQETVLRGRRVFLDFTENTGNREIPFDRLSEEARDYLSQAGALFGTPIERLEKMNQPAVSFYRDHGIDLHRDRLEIAVCAQHNNGGLSGNASWETNIRNLFAVGEVNGSHGVTRPGGTALNAGQCGALRCAECIHLRKESDARISFEEDLRQQALEEISLAEEAHGNLALRDIWIRAEKRMTQYGGMIRSPEGLSGALADTESELEGFMDLAEKPAFSQLPLFFRLRDMLISQKVYLAAMLDYAKSGAGSRGSALYTDPHGSLPSQKLPELFRLRLDAGRNNGRVQEISLGRDGKTELSWRAVRPIPDQDYFFENQWKLYRRRWKQQD